MSISILAGVGGKGDSQYQKVLKNFQQHTYPIHLWFNKHQKIFQLIENLGQNAKENAPNFCVDFDLAISVDPLKLFQFRFHGWPTFFHIFQ